MTIDVDAGAAWTFVSAVILMLATHQLQQGGRRRRRRREIREELELLKILGDDFPSVSHRIRQRVELAVEQYEPTPSSRYARRERWLSVISLAVAIVFMIPVILAFDVRADQPVRMAVLAAIAGTFGSGLELVLRRRLERARVTDLLDHLQSEHDRASRIELED